MQHLVREDEDNGPSGRLGVGERLMCASICCDKDVHNLSFWFHVCDGEKQGGGWSCRIYGGA